MRRPKAPELIVTVAAGVLLVGAAVGGLRSQDGPAAGSGSGTAIVIKGFQFGPQELDVKVGDKVTWTNEDHAAHAIRGDKGSPGQSKDLQTGDGYSFTFAKAGTFEYVCSIHSSMHGTVVVGS